MPFECGLERGRIKVSPAGTRRYPIIGAREQLAVTACGSDRSIECRTIMAHRFVIACAGEEVSWMRVAAAIRRAEAAPAWIKDGRLNVVLPASNSGATQPSCIDPPTFALGRTQREQRQAARRGCLTGRNDFDQVALPPGFAPVGEMGARLALAVAAEDPSGLDDEESVVPLVRVSNVAGETRVARADPGTIRDPVLHSNSYGAAYESAVAVDNWVTVVRTPESFKASAGDDSGDPESPWAWLLGGLALATFMGLACTRHAIFRWGLRPPMGSFTNAVAAVAALIEQTESVVSELADAGPLRDVLQSEIDHVCQRLASIEAAAGESEAAEAKASAQFRALVRELERIRRIADSAAASLTGGRPTGRLPRTRSEAYDILGVNADVSDGVLKKIVDALRMSWHPDHARNEADRRVREDRIRQINIAWELIAPKREVA